MTKRVLSVAGIGGLGVAMLIVAAAKIGHAQASAFPTSDRPAGYVVFAKVVVDVSDVFAQGRSQDTLVQLTNMGQDPRVVECFYINATSLCNNTNPAAPCRTSADCPTGGQCVPQWKETDFTILLTPDQPVGWRASQTTDLSVADPAAEGVVKPTDPYFLGELKCLEVDGDTTADTTTSPILANDLKGEATILDVVSGTGGSVDARSYNAIGFQAQSTLNGDQTLCLGATPGSTECPTADYAACPAVLVVDHFFDGAEDPVTGDTVTSDLTLVPCSENLTNGAGANSQIPTTAQILVFNEFEQRFSTAVTLACFKESQLSHIDQTVGNEKSSLFNFAVEGTLTGQTRVRPVLTANTEPLNGTGLLAVVEEFHVGGDGSHSAAFNVNYVGLNAAKGDIVRYNVGP